MLQSHNLLDVLDLLILHDLIVTRLANIEKFAAERKHTKIISTNDAQPSDCERFSGVSFRKDEGAVASILRPSIVGIGQLG